MQYKFYAGYALHYADCDNNYSFLLILLTVVSGGRILCDEVISENHLYTTSNAVFICFYLFDFGRGICYHRLKNISWNRIA